MKYGDWNEGPAYDIRSGHATYLNYEQDKADVQIQIKPHGSPDSEAVHLVGRFEYISNNSPTWIKMKYVGGKLVFGNGNARGKGWKIIDVATFGYTQMHILVLKASASS